MQVNSIALSLVALALSMLSLWFAWHSWRESHRPIVTVRVAPHLGGNVATAAKLVVENTGNRPARDIRLAADNQLLEAALAPTASDDDKAEIRACFSARFSIPILANGATVTNAFGVFSSDQQNTWCWPTRLPVTIEYRDLGGRRFHLRIDVIVAPNEGFAQTVWRE